MLETGIKVIDVICPLVAGGTVAIAGDLGAGITVVMEQLVRRLSGGSDPLSIFIMMPPPSPEWPYSLEPGFSHAKALSKEGYSEGTVGAVQTFFLRAEDGPWTTIRIIGNEPEAAPALLPTCDPPWRGPEYPRQAPHLVK